MINKNFKLQIQNSPLLVQEGDKGGVPKLHYNVLHYNMLNLLLVIPAKAGIQRYEWKFIHKFTAFFTENIFLYIVLSSWLDSGSSPE